MARHDTDHARDARDLKILKLLDEGLTQATVCARMGVTRGAISRLLREIRQDDEVNG